VREFLVKKSMSTSSHGKNKKRRLYAALDDDEDALYSKREKKLQDFRESFSCLPKRVLGTMMEYIGKEF